jgi:hypothetical protein
VTLRPYIEKQRARFLIAEYTLSLTSAKSASAPNLSGENLSGN